MDLERLLAPWPIPGPVSFRRIETGYINEIFGVEAASGRYVLRIYREPGDLSRILHEHKVAAWLQGAGLSFAVPAPIPTLDGRTLATVRGEDGDTYVSLIPFLPGVHPDFRILPQAEAAGHALGELVAALGAMKPDPSLAAAPIYGDLAHAHEAVTDPLGAIDWLPVEPEWRDRLRQIVTSALAEAPELYRRLPKQVIHGDFTHGNVLIEGDRAVGVLDFELSGWDLRAMDYAIGVGGGPKSLVAAGWGDWPVLEAFSRGYFRHHHLTDEELEAVPLLIRLRHIYILIRFTGRYRQGLDPEDVTAGMAWWTLESEKWLERNGATLVRKARQWAQAGS